MHEEQENIFYYLTTMNENYQHPEMPKIVKKVFLKECTYLKNLIIKEKQKFNY